MSFHLRESALSFCHEGLRLCLRSSAWQQVLSYLAGLGDAFPRFRQGSWWQKLVAETGSSSGFLLLGSETHHGFSKDHEHPQAKGLYPTCPSSQAGPQGPWLGDTGLPRQSRSHSKTHVCSGTLWPLSEKGCLSWASGSRSFCNHVRLWTLAQQPGGCVQGCLSP